MEVSIQAIHFDISDKLVAFVNKKIDKLARRFEFIQDVDANLRLIKPETALNKEAGIKLAVPGGPDMFASKTADTFEEAVDLAILALEPQLERFKDKDRKI
jgi:putative sigma-54 modulation protein